MGLWSLSDLCQSVSQGVQCAPMKRPTLASICFLLGLPAIAFAQAPTVERQIKGKPDTIINAGIFATLRNDCTAGRLPAVRLMTPPAHGQVTVK